MNRRAYEHRLRERRAGDGIESFSIVTDCRKCRHPIRQFRYPGGLFVGRFHVCYACAAESYRREKLYRQLN